MRMLDCFEQRALTAQTKTTNGEIKETKRREHGLLRRLQCIHTLVGKVKMTKFLYVSSLIFISNLSTTYSPLVLGSFFYGRISFFYGFYLSETPSVSVAYVFINDLVELVLINQDNGPATLLKHLCVYECVRIPKMVYGLMW